MVWLPDGEKRLRICFAVLTCITRVTDRRTFRRWHRPRQHSVARQKNLRSTLLKLTADKHEASRGLSATAVEPLVLAVQNKFGFRLDFGRKRKWSTV